MKEIKVGEFLRRHIDSLIELCSRDYQLFIDLQSTDYCSKTFGLLSRYSLLLEYDEIKRRGIYNRYYRTDYHLHNKILRVCSQFGGNHLINGTTASNYHGQQLLFFFKEKGILLEEFQNEELSFVVASPSSNTISSGIVSSTEKSIKSNPLNQILYGPPGTGKTYNTINRALEIIDGEVPQDRSEAKARFEELRSSGQIEFVTFHQSYGYEEFVEGIKANSFDGEISYDVEGGIFKKLSKRAENVNLYRVNDSEDFKHKIEKYRKLLESETIILKTATGRPFKLKVSPYGISTQTDHSFSINKLIEINNGILSSNPDGTYGQFIVDDINKRFNNRDNIEFESRNHILIIDEINRGNISKIFGELITLIEPSKRIGASEEVRLRLPYSNDEFGVPSNLYIIGTMNTADRSIALMDTALRRRFEFVEMMPDYEVLKEKVGVVSGVDISLFLQKINARVEYLYDRDHTIGHAYFIELNKNSSLDDLNAIMRNKIIPLLQEYFYDDWEKIKLVLNDGFINAKRVDATTIFESIDDEYIEEDKFVYSILDLFEEEAYLRLCQTR